MEYVCRKSKKTRNSYRIIGIIFVALGTIMGVKGWSQWTGMSKILWIIVIALVFMGLKYIGNSFRITCYDITYHMEEDKIRLTTRRGEKVLAYSDIMEADLQKPDPSLDYQILTIKREKGYPLVIHFVGEQDIAKAMFQFLESHKQKFQRKGI